MAGIAGFLGNDRGTLDLMLERIKYRGPDETWKHENDTIHIGCNELNVGGNSQNGSHFASDGTQAVALDGRVYNRNMETESDASAILSL